MEPVLNPSETVFVQKMMQVAIQRAAKALSVLLNEQIESRTLKLEQQVELSKLLPQSTPEETAQYLLLSLVKGDWTAQSFLILNQDNVEKMAEIAPGSESSLKKALLLEVDNILTAAVVSEMVDLLELQAYGDVPQMIEGNKTLIYQTIAKSLEDFPLLFSLNVDFYTQTESFSGVFIWCFPKGFHRIIQQNSNNPKKQKKLSELWREEHGAD